MNGGEERLENQWDNLPPSASPHIRMKPRKSDSS
jgi:hypothetical protein